MIRKVVPTDSFFNFFKPPQPPTPEDLESSEVDEDELEELDARLEVDYQIGEDFKEKIIPRAVDYFTGKALKYEQDFEDDEKEFDEDDEDFEDDEVGSLAFPSWRSFSLSTVLLLSSWVIRPKALPVHSTDRLRSRFPIPSSPLSRSRSRSPYHDCLSRT